jgi:serine phosphatase RsbU (regulator of sigma subunit)
MDKNSMRYAGAGHPPLLLWRASAGCASEVLENGLLLGLFPNATYSLIEIPLEPGDKAVLYTDGILETRSLSEDEFGSARFKTFLESNYKLKADEFVDLLLHELKSWSGRPKGDGQQDDITVVMVDFQSNLSA